MTTHLDVMWLDAERTKVKFALPQQEEWTAESVTELMHVLGQLRSEMSPSFPNDPPMFQSVGALTDPRWWTNLEEMSGGSLLMIRHPSLGWLPFYLSIESRNKMIELFQEHERIFSENKPKH